MNVKRSFRSVPKL